MELLPPTIKDDGSLALLGEILRVDYTLQDTSALRAKMFGGAFRWQAERADCGVSAAVFDAKCLEVLRRPAIVLLQRGQLRRVGGRGRQDPHCPDHDQRRQQAAQKGA